MSRTNSSIGTWTVAEDPDINVDSTANLKGIKIDEEEGEVIGL